MKISFSMFFLCVFTLAAESMYPQQAEVSLNLKNVTLRKAISEIEKESDYVFLIVDEVKNELDARTSIEANKESIYNILEKIFNDTGLGYNIVERQVSVYKDESNKKAESESVVVAQAPQRLIEITGVVIDNNGELLPGATIISKNSGVGTVTNEKGEFVIYLEENDKELICSFIGMETQTVNVLNKSNIRVVLQTSYDMLDEVIVTGYQTISKERATGAYNIIKTDQIEKAATNIGQRLIGTSSGVQAKTDVNGNVSFEIRGQSSLMATAQPLIVVDGFAIQGDLNSINPNDVKNITILKDAAASSIWGARAANGVIVITSKSGSDKGQGVRVNFTSFLKYSPKIDMDYRNPYASSAEIIEYEQKGFSTNFFGGPWPPIPNSNTSLTGSYSAAVEAMNENRLGFLSDGELNNILSTLKTRDNRDEIKKHMLQNPFSQQYNLSVSSSGERGSNILTLMYENNKTNLRGSDNEKYHVSFRNSLNVFKWLDFSFLGTFIMDDARNNGEVYSGSPYHMLFNEDGSRANVPNTFYWPNVERHVPYESFPYQDWSYNPLTEVESRDYRTRQLNARVQTGLVFKIMEGLNINSRIQYEMIKTDVKNIDNEESYLVRRTVNMASSWDRGTNKITPNLPMGAFLNQNRSERKAYNWRNQLNFNRNFADRHDVSFIGGTEISSIVNEYFGNPTTYGYDDDKLTVGTFPNGVGGSGPLKLTNWLGWNQTFGYTNSFSYSTDRYFSLYANASYSLDSKYTLSASVRSDASNLITDDPKYRYAPFWSIGSSWVISKERFMQQVDWLDRLTIRATYGFNGNVDKSTSFMPLINVPGTQNTYINDYTASISSFGNPTLRWEKTGTTDIGFDFSFLKGLLFGKLDFYNKKGRDLIVAMSIPAVNGTGSQKLNMAEMTNKGVELELGTRTRIYGNDIVWSGNFNISYNHNKIDKLFKTTYNAYELYGGGTSAYVEGYNANTLWAFEYAGVVNKGTESDPNWQPVVQGVDDEVYDFTGWTPGDGRDYMLDMGTKVAPLSLGFTSSFKIYDFDLSFIFTGKFGHKFNGLNFNYPSMSGGSALPNKLYSEIINSDPSDRVPIPFDKEEPRYYFWDRFYPYLDYRVQNANHVRFQELNVAYNVKRNVLDMIGLSSAKLYLQANNLFVLTNNKYNEDPEFPLGSLKPQPAYTFGVNLSF